MGRGQASQAARVRLSVNIIFQCYSGLTISRDAFMSRTSKHTGAIKALQFNAFRSELLATVGAKGELFVSDLNNVRSPFRMGNAVARADDFDCLDWNKRTAHILATGSSGGTMTVWDVKNKRESLTLNNLGRKPVSAIAWDPIKTTRLITAIPNDADPVILIWDLRNANAPERILQGHDGGILSLSWCPQDSDLLLSCGKDNRNICWNPQTGESYGEFPLVTNWTFQTRWNPSNPGLVATASFDGKIAVQPVQNTRPNATGASEDPSQIIDDDDFFSKAQTQPQGPGFSLQKPPKWLQRPSGASFGFGGKLVSFKTPTSESSKRSVIRVSTFAIDDGIVSSSESFEAALKDKDLSSICASRVIDAINDTEKAEWKIIGILTTENPRKHLVDYLGASNHEEEAADGVVELVAKNSSREKDQRLREAPVPITNRLSSFFDNGSDGETFLSELAATKTAKTNNPFKLYSGSETETDLRITRALLLGKFEEALDICVQDDRMSDAFMIAICGGQYCIEKAQKAYFDRNSEGPNYLRLLASIIGKNLWDLVHNADLETWKETMISLCTYADPKDFPDLCEALGERLEEHMRIGKGKIDLRKDALFCYLAGSKLDKVAEIWIVEMGENESMDLQDSNKDTSFSVHARCLQNFIEKVTIFRDVTKYQDADRAATSDWKLAPLYDKYIEYADIASAHGQLEIAERYLDLLPSNYPAAEVAKSRVRQATRKATPRPTPKQPSDILRNQPQTPQTEHSQQELVAKRMVSSGPSTNPYAPASQNKAQNPYAPTNGTYSAPGHISGGYQSSYQQPRQQPGAIAPQNFPHNQTQPVGPPPKNPNALTSIPPPTKVASMPNWNDTPEDFFKAPASRRGTPGVSTHPPSAYQSLQQPNMGSSFGPTPKSTPPLGPPPKGYAATSSGVSSSAIDPPQTYQQPARPSSITTANAPPLSTANLSVQQQPPIPRGPSPYNPPPSIAPPNNRYAPAQPPQTDRSSTQQQPLSTSGASIHEPPPSNPYGQQQTHGAPLPTPKTTTAQQPPRSADSATRSSGPSQNEVQQQESGPGTAQSVRKTASNPKYRKCLCEACTIIFLKNK